MRIRKSFAGAFFLLCLVAAYAGLTPLNFDAYINDKALHCLVFFLLTLVFYWILDTHRRRALNFTLIVCTGSLGVGSEILQAILPNGRSFDPYDIASNVIGSGAAVAICSWYHGRMLERRRRTRHYDAVPGEDVDDVELGEGHETGVVDPGEGPSQAAPTLEDEVDNWDENAEDNWDDNEEDDIGVSKKTVDAVPVKKRTD